MSDEPAPAVAVVVCAYTPDRLEQILAAVTEAAAQADGPRDEVVLVVDHHDDLLRQARAGVPAGVRVVPNAGRRGLSGARNCGAASTRADVVAFLDDDAVPRPGWVAALRARTSDPRVAVVGGAVHPAWAGGRAPRWFPPEFGWVVGCDYRGLPGDGAPIRNPIGASMAVRRSALDLAGGFSSELGRVGALPVGCEETLMGIRVRQALPAALIVRDEAFAVDHCVPVARQGVGYFLRRCFHEGRSKALVARAVGAGVGLSNERSYVLRSLSAALVRETACAARGDAAGLARAAAVLAGLGATAAGLLSAARPAPTDTAAPAHAAHAALAADEPISVVVCTLGRGPRLLGTVRAVLAQSYPHLELLVIDNDPTSGRVAALLEGVDDERLRVVPEPVRGLSAARNAGLAAAAGALVAYTDDDAVPDPTWLEALLGVLARDRDGLVTCVTGRVLAAETATVEQEWFERAGVFDKGTRTAVWSVRPTPVEVLGAPGTRSAFFPYTAGEVGSGNNMAFRTAALRALGGFDEALGAGSLARGGEDLDMFRRVLLAGDVVVYTPDAVVRHFHRDTYEALAQQVHGYGVGMAAVLTKLLLHGGRPALAVVGSLPRGVHHLLAPGSPKNATKPVDMPRALVWTELRGYLAGPALYGLSTLEARRRRAAAAGASAGRPS